MAAVVTRQIRIGADEHEALNHHTEQGDRGRYIRKALRNQLVADGFMPAPEVPPLLAKMNGAGTTRRRTPRKAKAKARPRRRARR